MLERAFAVSLERSFMLSYRVDRERWSQLGFCEQMANIGADVGRSIQAHRKGNEKRRDMALMRAYDLFDATQAQLAFARSPRLFEVQIAQSEFRKLFDEDAFDENARSLERYFNQFAIAAANEKRS